MTRTQDDFDDGCKQQANDIERQAAEWVARIDLRGTPDEWSALAAWLNASPRNRATFLRLSVAWRRADELKRLAPAGGVVDPDLLDPARWTTEPSDDPVLEGRAIAVDLRIVDASANDDDDLFAHDISGSRLRALVTSRIAASVTAFAIMSVGSLGAWYAVEQTNTQTYLTHIGEFRRVTLEDGSTIALNTDTEVRVHYSSGARHVDLAHGEALFQVTKNKERPFDVEAGSTTVRAVGTAFSVRLHDAGTNERVDVVVSEGRVAINPPSSQTYAAGSAATVRNGHVNATVLNGEDMTSRFAWTIGRVMFQGEKLSDVIEEINRYNLRKLEVADPDIAGIRVGGTFQATDPDGLARALAATFGIKSHLVTRSFGDDVIKLDSGVP